MAIDRRNEREQKIEHIEADKIDTPTYNVAAPFGRPEMTESNYNDLNEEMAQDFAVGSTVSYVPRDETEAVERSRDWGGTALGWTALAFAVASWFVWPVLLGLTSIALGGIAFWQGARTIGGWAIAIGLIAVLLSLVVVPLYYALT
ncbi:hypothetical protein [Paenibacillus sp. NPDC058071]|uniref:hypothetical protein n=1 Tax=Paenibacillus sp. NPDC058071 TaxID=3346326 RepID=UPI0036DA26F9